MRKKEREVSEVVAWQYFDESPFSTVSCCDGNKPYAINLNCARVGSTIYFHCAKSGKKLDIFERNQNVCLSAVSYHDVKEEEFTTYYHSVYMEGTIRIVKDDNEKIIGLRAICERFTPSVMERFEGALKSLPATCVAAIEVSMISGKRKMPK